MRRTTFKVPFWFLLSVGVLMTGYFARDLNPLWTIPLGGWMLVPYWLLFRWFRAARSCTLRAAVLVALLVVVGFSFWSYFDRKFVHLSSIDNSPIEVPFEQLLLLGGGWLLVRRVERLRCRADLEM